MLVRIILEVNGEGNYRLGVKTSRWQVLGGLQKECQETRPWGQYSCSVGEGVGPKRVLLQLSGIRSLGPDARGGWCRGGVQELAQMRRSERLEMSAELG
jgi:hypothetical protein